MHFRASQVKAPLFNVCFLLIMKCGGWGGVCRSIFLYICVSLNFMYSLFVINSSLKPPKCGFYKCVKVIGENKRLCLKLLQIWEEEEE